MPSTSNKARVIIYTRPGCHLCDEAKQVMLSSGCDNEYTLEEIDIESNPALLRRYQFDIPVITINGVEAFRHRLTVEAFRQRVQEEAGASPGSPARQPRWGGSPPSRPGADCD